MSAQNRINNALRHHWYSQPSSTAPGAPLVWRFNVSTKHSPTTHPLSRNLVITDDKSPQTDFTRTRKPGKRATVDALRERVARSVDVSPSSSSSLERFVPLDRPPSCPGVAMECSGDASFGVCNPGDASSFRSLLGERTEEDMSACTRKELLRARDTLYERTARA